MKKLIEKYGKKKIYLSGIIASSVFAVVLILFAVLQQNNPLVLKQDEFIVEYGDVVSTKAHDYLKTEDQKVLEKTEVIISNLKNESEKKYAGVGSYKAVAKYNDKSIEFTIEIKDTKAPVFIDFMEEIVIEENAEDVDLSKYFQAEDLSEVTISVDSKKVELDKIGEYEMQVTATDKYKNADTKTVKVKIISLEVASKEDGVTKTLDGTVYQSKALKDKIAEDQKAEEKEQEVSNGGGLADGNANMGGSTSGSNSNTSGSTSGGNSNTGGSTNGGNSNTGAAGGNNNNTGESQTPSNPNVCVSNGQYGRLGNSNQVFYSKTEADTYAKDFIINQVDWVYQGYTAWTVYDNCGERNDIWTVNFY